MSEHRKGGWRFRPLRELAQVVSGGTPSRYVDEFWEDGTIPWVTPTDLTKTVGRVLFDTREKITHRGLASCSATLLPAGTLLMTSRATLGEIRIAEREACTNQGFKSLVPLPATHGPFLYYQMLQNKERYSALGIGSTFLEVNKRDTERFEVLVPPDRSTQQRIAEILSTVDEAIELTEALIAKTQQIKAGLMHDLFTRGVTVDGQLRPSRAEAPQAYKQSGLGWIPSGWEIKPLADLCGADITYGIVQAGPHIDGGVPYVRTGDMAGDRLIREDMLCTSPRIAAAYTRSEVRAGEIVCAIRATVGKVLPVPDELDGANLTQGTARISPKPSVDRAFLLWSLRANSTQSWLATQIKGTTFSEITLTDLRLLPVAVPPSTDEQNAIAARMAACADQVFAGKEALKKLAQIKRGLMRDLLTGSVEVVRDIATSPEEAVADV